MIWSIDKFMVYPVMLLTVVRIHQSLKAECPVACMCGKLKVNCTNNIPETLSNDTQEVVIFNPARDVMFPRAFCNASWPSVLRLTIHTVSEDLFLVDHVFECLNTIEALKIQNDESLIVRLYQNTFKGLDSVRVLDLTNCSRMASEDIHISFSEKDVLLKLTHLILVGVSTAWDPFQWTQSFTNMLGYRNITEINLSYASFNIHVEDFSPICDTLEKINIAEAIISNSEVNDDKPCPSLKSIDVSGTRFPKAIPLPKRIQLRGIKFDLSHFTRPLYETISTVYANRLISPDHIISIKNSTLELFIKNALHEFHGNNYNIPYMDCEIKISTDHLTYLDMSSNSIETIGPRVFRNLVELRKLSLSNNRLSMCSSFNSTFSVLFEKNANMEELNLANNALNYLPPAIFIKNRNLKRLDLSNNIFDKITFGFSHLNYLTTLDLKNNKIEFLDSSTMKTLDHLYKNTQMANRTGEKNETLSVNLLGNPLKCNCITLKFIEWFIQTLVFKSTRHLYRCESEGQSIKIDTTAVAEAKEDCNRPIRRRRLIIMCSTIPTISLISAITVIFVLRRRLRMRQDYQRFEETVQTLRNGVTVFEFPVLLSYSSEDHTLVTNHILQPLQVYLQSIVETDKELVCTGDEYIRPGRSIFRDLGRCIENCGLVVAVMSLNYCRSIYCKMEIEEARIQGKPVIMIFIEEVDESEMSEAMKEVFRNFARIKLVPDGEGYRSQPNWHIVCQSIIQLLQES